MLKCVQVVGHRACRPEALSRVRVSGRRPEALYGTCQHERYADFDRDIQGALWLVDVRAPRVGDPHGYATMKSGRVSPLCYFPSRSGAALDCLSAVGQAAPCTHITLRRDDRGGTLRAGSRDTSSANHI